VLNFASGAAISAALAAAVLGLALRGASSAASTWATAGFAAMALPILATGAWLAHEQGRAGVSFVIALGTGLLIRAMLLVLVVAGAASQGPAMLKGVLAGLAIGFVPMTAFEMIWFSRRAQGIRPHMERRT
jgi:hypothetical protein